MGQIVLSNEDGKSVEFVGDNTLNGFIQPAANERIIVKGMLISGDGNNGITRITTSTGKVLLALYHSVNAQLSPSGRTHLILEVGEEINIVSSSRGPTNNTFVGISVEREFIFPES